MLIQYRIFLLAIAFTLIIFPAKFIKQHYEQQTLNPFNQISSLILENEFGLRLTGVYFIFLLLISLKKIRILQIFGILIYLTFLVLMVLGILFSQDHGQAQSYRLERFGLNCGIFAFVLHNNWPEKKKIDIEEKEEVRKEVKKEGKQENEGKQELKTKAKVNKKVKHD